MSDEDTVDGQSSTGERITLVVDWFKVGGMGVLGLVFALARIGAMFSDDSGRRPRSPAVSSVPGPGR